MIVLKAHLWICPSLMSSKYSDELGGQALKQAGRVTSVLPKTSYNIIWMQSLLRYHIVPLFPPVLDSQSAQIPIESQYARHHIAKR